jgi:predicted RNA binding protein YcfA (HicA-like mRNA interferase family)
MKYREVEEKLLRLGCTELLPRGKGSHCKWIGPGGGGFAVIPDHGSQDVSKWLLKNAIKLLGITWKQFIEA